MLNSALLLTLICQASMLPIGNAPQPVLLPHFPSRLHAYTWLNWQLVPTERLAQVVHAKPEDILTIGKSMGLPKPPEIREEHQIRSYITVIRRNWHLLPYEQLLTLLGWDEEKLAYTLREDDFLFVKLGNVKPDCEPLMYRTPTESENERALEIAELVQRHFPDGLATREESLFDFVDELSQMPAHRPEKKKDSLFSPRFCASYFALYGDPYLETEADSFPEGYLARLHDSGVDGVWMQAVLYKMTRFPWDESRSEQHEERLENLASLVAKCKKQGINVYLYLNEPRAMPLAFFEQHPELKGAVEGDHAALCTSVPEVRTYIRNSVRTICEAVPDLAGFFTITASENLTNCWSHYQGASCPRCGKRGPAEVIAQLNATIQEGIEESGSKAELIVWDWGWQDHWSKEAIEALPEEVSLMSVSEWSIAVERGGVPTSVGEYSISVVGPGPRATRHWEIARKHRLKTVAKVQANNTWEISSLPYIPALENVAQHAANVRDAQVDGLMLGWTLGGCPSPNLEVFAEMGRSEKATIDEVLLSVATRRFGSESAPAIVKAWKSFSEAFREYPYHGSLMYTSPQQIGPANPLWSEPTGYGASMVGFPYDALEQWRAAFPREVFIAQFTKMADGFDQALEELQESLLEKVHTQEQSEVLQQEMDMAKVCSIHFRSVANQARFVIGREQLASSNDAETIQELETVLRSEINLAKALHEIQTRDSRIGYEASNHYFYVPLDLAAKVVNCEYLLSHWLKTNTGSSNEMK